VPLAVPVSYTPHHPGFEMEETTVSITRQRRPTGWAIFAATVLILVGFFNIVYGLTALLHEHALVATPSGELVVFDLKSWGWITLIIGILMVATGIGLFAVGGWARWLAIGFAVINAVGWIGLINVYPYWALAIIALDVLIVYNLSVHWQPEVR
jgi:hypothetical protein